MKQRQSPPYSLPQLLHLLSSPHSLSLLLKTNLLSSPTSVLKFLSSSLFPLNSVHLYNHLCTLSFPLTPSTFTLTLKSLARLPRISLDPNPLSLSALHKGSEIHCRLLRSGFSDDVHVLNSLITVYSNCGRPDLARKVFDEMPLRTVVTWNAMLAGYSRNGDFPAADWVVSAMPERNVATWNAVIGRYVRAGDLVMARRVFDGMGERDSVSWNSLIAGCVRVRDYGGAVELYRRMVGCGVEATELTVVSVLGACAETGAMGVGREVYECLKRRGVAVDGFVGNAVLDMFAKCGDLKMARRVFEEMDVRHVSCWNTMIVALAVHGYCDEALGFFLEMDQKPNRVTFLGVLLAYSHKGLVEEGREFFRRMVEEYKVEPDIKHYGCMVDMLSRMGFVAEAYKMVKSMPMKANLLIWKTLLGACKVHGGVELAEEAFCQLGVIGPLSNDDYVLMSNIYADANRWDDVERLRSRMVKESISKQVGYSKIES